jgi:hypothetical protein
MATTGISFHHDTVELLAASAVTDRYGNDTLDWSDPTVTSISNCRVLPEAGTEILDRVTRRWVLFAPPDTPLDSAHRVRWDGVIYGVIGEVRRWPSPSGALAHIEADLERVEG